MLPAQLSEETARQLSRVCHAAAKEAKIKKRVTMYTLRHSFATTCPACGGPMIVIEVFARGPLPCAPPRLAACA